MPRHPDLPCTYCGNLGWRGTGTLLDAYVCRPCRRAYGVPTSAGRPAHAPRYFNCGGCGAETRWSKNREKYCGIGCANRAAGKARSLHPESSKTRHSQRCSVAPGLTYTQRKALMQTWRKQHRCCSYCNKPATTMDHVIPLIRGGTNFEGNLAPACKSCNSSKGGLLLTEWRTGRRCTPVLYVLPTPRRKPKPLRPAVAPRPCFICGQEFTPKQLAFRTCSKPCSYECGKRQIREKYRAKVGLPPTWETPTTPQLRRAS